MKLLMFYAYIFYRLKKYYPIWQAILVFNGVILFQIWSIVAIYASALHLPQNDFLLLRVTHNYFYDRFVLGTLRIGPVFLLTFVLSRIFKEKLSDCYDEFANEPENIIRKRKIGMILYYVFTVVFFVFSIVSSSFF